MFNIRYADVCIFLNSMSSADFNEMCSNFLRLSRMPKTVAPKKQRDILYRTEHPGSNTWNNLFLHLFIFLFWQIPESNFGEEPPVIF